MMKKKLSNLTWALGVASAISFGQMDCNGAKKETPVAVKPPVDPEPEINTDPYNEQFALIKTMNEFFPKVVGRVIPEQEQKELSEELKKIYVEAFAKDTYSANFPFSSAQLKAAITPLEYKFPYSFVAEAGLTTIWLGTKVEGII